MATPALLRGPSDRTTGSFNQPGPSVLHQPNRARLVTFACPTSLTRPVRLQLPDATRAAPSLPAGCWTSAGCSPVRLGTRLGTRVRTRPGTWSRNLKCRIATERVRLRQGQREATVLGRVALRQAGFSLATELLPVRVPNPDEVVGASVGNDRVPLPGRVGRSRPSDDARRVVLEADRDGEDGARSGSAQPR